MKLIQILSDIMCNTLLGPAVMKKCRIHPGDFTRNTGKFPYLTLIKLLLKNSKHTISASLDEFFSNLCAMENIPLSDKTRCSQQAFSKARKKLSPKLFKICFNRMLDFLCSKDSLAFYKRFEGLVLQSQVQLKDFAEKENVVLDEGRITDAVNKFMHYINESIRDSIEW